MADSETMPTLVFLASLVSHALLTVGIHTAILDVIFVMEKINPACPLQILLWE